MNKISAIQKEIKATIEEFESIKNIESHVNEININLKSAFEKLKALDKNLDKELNDINKLEKFGLKSLFYKTLGNKEEQMEIERQEYLEASLKYKELKERIELMEYEKDVLNKKLRQLPNLEAKLAALKKDRENEILTTGDDIIRNEFKEILHQTDVNILIRKELIEAIDEGEKALAILKKVIQSLRQAGGWGRWENYDRRRQQYYKRQAIDSAFSFMTRAQHQLNIFTRELKDLGDNNIHFNLNKLKFNNATDFFFDNLISDWIIQQKIKNSLTNVDSNMASVNRIVLSLKKELSDTEKKLKSLDDKREQFLLS